MTDLQNIGNEKLPSVINDPFKKNQITKIFVWAGKTGGKWSFSGDVEFTCGSTSGTQEFRGESFDDVVLKIKAMLETME